MSIWFNIFTEIDFIQNIYLLLFVTVFGYWGYIKSPKLTILYDICWLGITSTNLLLFLVLGSRWLVQGYFPLSNLYESLLFLDWSLLFVLFFAEIKLKTRLVGAILVPIILSILSFAGLILPKPMQIMTSLVPSLQSRWLMMHVSMMMLSYSTLILGSLLSILFLIVQNITNKNKKKSSYDQLLENVDIWSYRTIGIGLPLLTLGIIAGAVWANEAWGAYWSWDPKETWALITWLYFATYVHARLAKGWGGKNTAIIGSIGFFVIWVCYLGVNFLGQGLHSYGFVS